MSLENWGSVFDACNNNDPDLDYCHFMGVYLNLFNKSFPVIEPLRFRKHFPKQKWITPALVNVVKSKLCKKFILLPMIINESKFKKYRNKFKSLFKAAEKSYSAELFANCGNDLIKT